MAVDRLKINAWMRQTSLQDDDAAFGALASAVQDELFRLCLANGLSRDDAIEATQETFLRAYRGRKSWEPDSSAMSWICGIAINVVRERHRQERRHRKECAAWIEGWGEALNNLAGDTARDHEVGGPEQLQQLLAAVADLPSRQREAIACRYLRRMSVRDTAAAMECAEGTVKSAVSAALQTLRAMLVRRR
jgi:RNA polymerase sigma-70 factor (ECF subfamily)